MSVYAEFVERFKHTFRAENLCLYYPNTTKTWILTYNNTTVILQIKIPYAYEVFVTVSELGRRM
jgi:hypothetical protein